MVARCHSLRKVPLEKLSAGDCRVLLTQGIGTEYLVPLALVFVEARPLLEGDYYPGDLLLALLGVEESYWAKHKVLRSRLISVATQANTSLAELSDPSGSDQKLMKEVNAFLSRAAA